jgi:hypothetical protein
MAEFIDFLKAVVKHWGVLATGVVISLLTLAWGQVRYLVQVGDGPDIPPKLFYAVGFSLIFTACFLAWRDEHREKNEAIKKATVMAKPSLLLTYDGYYPTGYKRASARHPLSIHNDGPRAAVNISFEPMVLSSNVCIHIEDIQMIGPYANAEAKCSAEIVFDDGAAEIDTPDELGDILFRAREIADHKKGTLPGPWPLAINYIDSDSRQFRREYEVEIDPLRRVTLLFKQ